MIWSINMEMANIKKQRELHLLKTNPNPYLKIFFFKITGCIEKKTQMLSNQNTQVDQSNKQVGISNMTGIKKHEKILFFMPDLSKFDLTCEFF